jgi:hypothetical protein
MKKPKKITNRILDEVLEEGSMDAGGTIFGGAAYGGSGTFSYSQQAGAKTWSPRSPQQRISTSDPQGYNVKDIGDEEAMFKHMAPKKMPFPLEGINEFIAMAYIQLCNIENQLKTCKTYSTVLRANKEKKALIAHLHRKSKAIKIMLMNMSEDLDKIAFS